MESKYYTPEIEEFCVGFEFEFRRQNSGSNSTTRHKIDGITYDLKDLEYTDWHKHYNFNDVFGDYDYDSIDDLSDQIEKGRVRVKYLDQSDIKELGWKLGEINFNSFTIGFKTSFEEGEENILIYNSVTEEVKFCGFIKNKSELKKIMKQLSISKE